MATKIGDIRYKATCKKCHAPIGDWAMKVPESKRVCWDCRPHDIKKIPYRKENICVSHLDVL